MTLTKRHALIFAKIVFFIYNMVAKRKYVSKVINAHAHKENILQQPPFLFSLPGE